LSVEGRPAPVPAIANDDRLRKEFQITPYRHETPT
jgi:hypothetical protein